MRNIRLVGRLDVKGPKVINTIRLEGLRVVGEPNRIGVGYYNEGVDELLIIDQVASLYQRGHIAGLIRDFATQIFIPVTVGGGVKTVEDARILLRSGADKVAVNTAAIRRPELINELVREFGSQCVVASIQAKKTGEMRWEAFCDGGRERTGRDAVHWGREVVDRGAGEVLVTSIDRDGTRKGFEVDLMAVVSEEVKVPVVASGGLGQPSDAVALLESSACEAFAVADFLHSRRGTVNEIKEFVGKAGFVVRRIV